VASEARVPANRVTPASSSRLNSRKVGVKPIFSGSVPKGSNAITPTSSQRSHSGRVSSHGRGASAISSRKGTSGLPAATATPPSAPSPSAPSPSATFRRPSWS
jgi:hypothetical protein